MFKKQFFPEATIKSLATNHSVYEKGLSLFKNGKVKDLTLNEENRSIEFTVADGQDKKTYLSFLKNGLAQKYSCNCSFFQKQSGACQHVIASMLYLNTINQESFNSLNSQEVIDSTDKSSSSQLGLLQKNREVLTNLFTEAKKEIDVQTISFNKFPLQFEFVLNMYESNKIFEYEMYLKVGLDHLYVIKDIVDVATHLLKGNEYVFGKQLTYNPRDYSIAPEDRELLAYIQEIGVAQEEALNLMYIDNTGEKNGSLSIPPKNVPELLELLSEVEGGFVRFAAPPRLLSSLNQLESPRIAEPGTKIPITFNITKNEDHFLLDINPADKQKKVALHRQADMVSVDSVFYLLNAQDYSQAQLLINAIKSMSNQPLKLTKDDLTSFYSLIVPQLKKLFKYKVEEGIEEQIKKEPLKPELYIDYQQEELTIEPLFQYGEATVNPLISRTDDDSKEQDESSILIRDVVNENDISNVLNHFFKGTDVTDGKYVIDKFEEISAFIYDSLSELSNLMDVFLTERAQDLIYDQDYAPQLSVEMNRSTNLLDISFDVENISDDEIPNLIRQLQKSDNRFYKLKSGKIIDLKEKDFEKLADNVNKLELDPEEISDKTSVSLLRGLTVTNEENVTIGNHYKEFIKELNEPENLSFMVPESLNARLRPYQETGFKWMSMLDYYGLSGVLADDMGLGKTIQTITFILSKIEEHGGKYLIISPSSVVYNWEREFEQFAPKINTKVISGTIEEREEQLEFALTDEKIDVLVTSYPLIQRDIEIYKDKVFETIVLDESQNVKNSVAKTTKAVKRLQAKNIFALSGTPIENNLNELWSLFSIILPSLFRSKKVFKELSEVEIAKKIDLFVLRRLKEDVLDDLPPKTETVEFIELSEEQKRLYQAQLSLIRNDVEQLIEQDTFEQNRMRVLAGMTRLRQICCDPRLINPEYSGGSAKLERLIEYLREAFANNKRVVLFSQFTSMLSIIREILDEDGVDYHYLDGSTPKIDRLDLTTRFNEGKKDLFLISLRAGGTGLNLTGGDTVILYDSWWNPAVEDQAADRVHRFGQKKPVQVIRMIMKGTIEEGINELQEQKRELIDSVIRKDETQKVKSLTKEDILELLTN